MSTFGKKFKLDKRDKEIITLLQENPQLTEEELAEKLGLSTEIVGARITKLLRANLLEKRYGVSFKKTDLVLARVDFYAKNPDQVMKQFGNCPFGLNLYKISGSRNFSIELVGADMTQIEGIIDACFRTNPNIENIKTCYVFDSSQDIILRMNFDLENIAKYGCLHICEGGTGQEDLLEIVEEIKEEPLES